MTPEQPVRAFGSKSAVAEVCKITVAAVSMWSKRGGIPYDKQCLLQVEWERRKGEKRVRLVARREDDPKHREREAA